MSGAPAKAAAFAATGSQAVGLASEGWGSQLWEVSESPSLRVWSDCWMPGSVCELRIEQAGDPGAQCQPEMGLFIPYMVLGRSC